MAILTDKTGTTIKSKAQGAFSILGLIFTRRDGLILTFFIILAIILFARLFTLTVVDARELSDEGSTMRTTELSITARRGTIYDRNGNVLATSVDATTIYANPSKIIDAKETAEILHEVLGGKTEYYYELILENRDSTFVYLAKKVDPELEQALRDINQEFIVERVNEIQAQGDDIPAEIETPLTGIEYLPDTRREYPKGNTGAQIIGSVNDEGVGVSGLERVYEEILCGIDGVRVLEEAKQISQNNAPLPMINSVIEDVPAIAGSDIIISIDIEVQQYLELSLEAVAHQRDTDNASSILLDGETGEVIATASIPLYDREHITQEDAENGATNAKAITQPFEPGSTFKAIIAGIALETDLMTAKDTLFCPAELEIYDKIVKDAAERYDEEMSLRDIVARSSNVGVSLIGRQVGDEAFYNYIDNLGFGSYTHIDYPGETSGNLAPYEEWTPIQAANISFGQGIEVSLLQMASLYGAIANDGMYIEPHFLISRPQSNVEIEYDSKRVFEGQTCRDLEDLLRSVVTDGTGSTAAIEGYDVVGKTGTAEMGHAEGGYENSEGHYITSFAGYIDNSTSKLVFISSFEDPLNYADSPATPLFSVVMSFIANRDMIEPLEEGPYVEPSSVEETPQWGAGATAEATGDENSATARKTAIEPSTPRAVKDWLIDTSG